MALALLFSCGKKANDVQKTEKPEMTENQPEKIIGKPQIDLSVKHITAEMLWAFGRISGVSVSPDKSNLLFSVKYYDIAENKGNAELYTLPLAATEMKQITQTAKSEFEQNWLPVDNKISFLFADGGAPQIWVMNADGSSREKISEVENGVNAYQFTADGKKVLFVSKVKLDKDAHDLYPDLPKANALIYDELMYRHWDSWDDYSYSHIFTANFDGKKLSNIKDIMEGERFDTPLEPMGGIEQINWSPDGKSIAYTCKKLNGKKYALSTNSDIYIFDTQTGQTTNLTEGNLGYDTEAIFSPDGSKIAWLSMERDGFEADKNRLMVFDFATQTKTDLTANIDQSASSIVWNPDSKTLYFISGIAATFQVFKTDIETKQIQQLTKGDHDYTSLTLADGKLIGTKMTMTMPVEIFSIDANSGEEKQLSFVNKEINDNIAHAKVEKRMVKTTDGKEMLVWVILPPDFDPNKKYPALLYCQGGPQSAVSQFYSFRWNFEIMAANGYVIVAPNRRGLPTFGQEWNDQISKDYGGQNMKDYLSAIDAVSKEPYIDKDHLGAVGASYGGFSVYWLAGNHTKRFKAFIAHCGIFNFESMYTSTEETFFSHWDMGGAPWAKEAKNSYGASPHLFVKNWDTPILVIHGEKDFRIPYTEGMSAFNSAQLRDIPSRFLIFPEENHWVLTPQNGILWQREFFSWLDKYLK